MDSVRYIGLDIHKHYIVLCGINAEQEITLKPRQVKIEQFQQWVNQHLTQDDAVVLEATTNAWDIYDMLASHVRRAVVVHSYHVKMIASASVKTDKRDALALARLLAANLVPAVWVPPVHVRQLRSLVKHRQHLMKQRTAAMNRLQGLLHRYNLKPPSGGAFALKNRAWWFALKLSAIEGLRIRHDLQTLDWLEQQLTEVQKEFCQQSIHDPWKAQVPFLLQIPGVGLLSAMTILSAIGDISRFPTSQQLVGYSGLGARVHASGQTYREGKLTKQGREELRAIMIEVAWVAVRYSSTWKYRPTRCATRLK